MSDFYHSMPFACSRWNNRCYLLSWNSWGNRLDLKGKEFQNLLSTTESALILQWRKVFFFYLTCMWLYTCVFQHMDSQRIEFRQTSSTNITDKFSFSSSLPGNTTFFYISSCNSHFIFLGMTNKVSSQWSTVLELFFAQLRKQIFDFLWEILLKKIGI